MTLSKIEHLSKADIIKNGSVFTPEYIVKVAREWLFPIIKSDDYIIDFGVGYGSFISQFLDLSENCIATDIDGLSIRLVNQLFPSLRTFTENSLIQIERKKYGIPRDSRLFVIGNPPYNDLTSQYKKGQKGSFEVDSSIKSRDLGLSFLKMYASLDASYICVLHPLSYLIKKTNFSALGFFKENYVLERGLVFSSKHFESIKKTNIEFPVVLALYRKEFGGMQGFDFIKEFSFEVLNSSRTFCMKNISVIDGIINKYPTKEKTKDDLQFYTIRDINALKRNATFIKGNCNNGIKVDIADLYKYAWLDYFKHFFETKNYFLYGNLSPFYSIDIELVGTKKELISYILNTNSTVKDFYSSDNHKRVLSYYKMDKILDKYPSLEGIMKLMIDSL